MISEQGRDSRLEENFPECFIYIFRLLFFGLSQFYDTNVNPKKTGGKEGDRFLLMEKRAKISFPRCLVSYPAAAPLCGLLL